MCNLLTFICVCDSRYLWIMTSIVLVRRAPVLRFYGSPDRLLLSLCRIFNYSVHNEGDIFLTHTWHDFVTNDASIYVIFMYIII